MSDRARFKSNSGLFDLVWHPNLGELEPINIVLIAYLVKEFPGVLHMIANSATLHRLDKPKLVSLAQMRLIKIVISTAQPYLV